MGGPIEFSTAATSIDGLLRITMRQASDARGTVRELFRASTFDAQGLEPRTFRQINATESRRGAVRGIHAESMTKIVTVVHGEAFAAWVDLRPDSTTFRAVVTDRLVPGVQVRVPEGVGNGFQALVDGTQYVYCFDREWRPDMPGWACHPLDPALGIEWPLPVDVADRAQLSAKDAAAPLLADLLSERAR
jgi:dTDP-4-dehydrorhamnose 3,5-epimerase